LVIVDEAYAQFASWSAVDLVDESRALVVTRTYSKTWSMAAARLGYLVGPKWLVEEIDAVVLPYHLDAAKQIAGALALEFTNDMNSRVREIVASRDQIESTFSALPVDFWPSGANFILFRPRSMDGRKVWSELVEKGVLIRDCSSWPGLTNCLRVTIGTPEENDLFLKSLSEVLSK
jgi:histidinol-phosphate aminotransferase